MLPYVHRYLHKYKAHYRYILHSRDRSRPVPTLRSAYRLRSTSTYSHVGWANSLIVCPPFADINGGQKSVALHGWPFMVITDQNLLSEYRHSGKIEGIRELLNMP